MPVTCSEGSRLSAAGWYVLVPSAGGSLSGGVAGSDAGADEAAEAPPAAGAATGAAAGAGGAFAFISAEKPVPDSVNAIAGPVRATGTGSVYSSRKIRIRS